MKFGTRGAMIGMFAPLLMLGGCGGASEQRRADRDQPLDGGYSLFPPQSPELDKIRADDPCWRREPGGWHLSVGHCEEMLPAQSMTGVWVTGFEESSFFPGSKTLPDRNDSRRYRLHLEVDGDRVGELVGRKLNALPYRAYRLKFTGRRTRYPTNIDCYGGREYVFVADEIAEAEYLGTMNDPDLPPPHSDRAGYKFLKRSGEGGKVRKMEEEALARC